MRVRVFLLLLLGLSAGIASGQPANDPLESCAAEKDDAARLACFDRQMALRHGSHATGAPSGAAAPVQAAPPPAVQSHPPPDHPAGQAAVTRPQVTQPQEMPAPPAATQAARVPDPDIGLQGSALHKKLKEEGKERQRPAPVSATVARLVPLSHSEYAFQLDNGQVWQQTDDRAGLSLKVNDPVTINAGSFGDFFFITPSKLHIRVKRLR